MMWGARTVQNADEGSSSGRILLMRWLLSYPNDWEWLIAAWKIVRAESSLWARKQCSRRQGLREQLMLLREVLGVLRDDQRQIVVATVLDGERDHEAEHPALEAQRQMSVR